MVKKTKTKFRSTVRVTENGRDVRSKKGNKRQ